MNFKHFKCILNNFLKSKIVVIKFFNLILEKLKVILE